MEEKELYQPKLLIKAYDKKDSLKLFDEVFNMMNCKNIFCKESRVHYEYDEKNNIIKSEESIMADSNRSKVTSEYSDKLFTVRKLETKFPKIISIVNQNVIVGDREKLNSITRISEETLMKSKVDLDCIVKTINTTTFKSGDILDSMNMESSRSASDFFFLFSLAPAFSRLRAAVIMLEPLLAVVIFSLPIFFIVSVMLVSTSANRMPKS